MQFIISLTRTDQGRRAIKDTSKRAQSARELSKKVGVEMEHIWFTSGDTDIVAVVNAPNGDNVAKFVLALGSLGNVCTKTVRAWSEAEFLKLVSELP